MAARERALIATGTADLGEAEEPNDGRMPLSTIATWFVKVWIVFWFLLWMFLSPERGGWVFWVVSVNRVFWRAVLWRMWLRWGDWVARSVLAVCAWVWLY